MEKKKSRGYLILLLVGLSLLLMFFCVSPEPESLPEISSVPVPETRVTELETEAKDPALIASEVPAQPEEQGVLFLSVSEIQFSFPGEKESIYAGSVPPEKITWQSSDESVVTVENGVVTATGVGTAVVTASCPGQQVSCTAGCLAETEEALKQLPVYKLRTPKRIPPQVDDGVLSFYEDTAMLGDSITYSFMKYEAKEARLGNPRCLCRGKLGISNLLTHNLDLYFEGAETPVEDVLAAVDPQKVFILLGTNDVMLRPAEDVLEELDTLLDRILAKNPDLQIYLQSVFPIACGDPAGNSTNEKITYYNEKLQQFAEQRGYFYVSIAPYLQDHVPGLAEPYVQDTYHPNYQGVNIWIDALRAYAYEKQIKGDLK